jgi:hypothetical protein
VNTSSLRNLTIAQALGLTIRESFLLRVDEVIEESGRCPSLALSGHASDAEHRFWAKLAEPDALFFYLSRLEDT